MFKPIYSPAEAAVIEILNRHVGRDHGLHISELTAEVNLAGIDYNQRRVRRTVEDLVLVYGLPVGSNPVHGYYLIDAADPADLTAALVDLKRRGLANLARYAALLRIEAPALRIQKDAATGQLNLFEEI